MLVDSYPLEFVGGKIGIITPYRSQLSLLRSRFSAALGSSIMDEMELNTVDGFQGREVDILVVSTVRASSGSTETNSNRGIGFVADVRRMNVALTRAKHSLWILGNVRTLQTNKNWGALVKDAKDRNLVLSFKKPYASVFNSLSKKSNCASDDISKQINRHTEQPRRFNPSSKNKRGHHEAQSSDSGQAKKKSKVQYYDSLSANKDSESENKVKTFKDAKPGTDEDCQGKEEKQKPKHKHKQKKRVDNDSGVDMQHDVRSRSVERPIDPSCKRKQQREAVDALLPSAFISSKKKPESSSKSVRSVRPSDHAIKKRYSLLS